MRRRWPFWCCFALAVVWCGGTGQGMEDVFPDDGGDDPAHAVLVWTNCGAAAPYYVGVEGYLRFTTGTYSLAVTAANWTDADADGLPDEWEQQWLGGLGDNGDGDADKDGMSNLNEYLAGTHPSNAASRLVITAIEREADTAVIYWPAMPYAVYRVTARDELRSDEWEAIGVRRNMTATPAALSWPDGPAATNRFYRIELLTGE